jgi:uncharacterized protein (DUF1697 family)
VKAYVALLRGINVGGHMKVAVSDLRGLLTELGFADARSLLQSGNLVFRTGSRTPASLEKLLEAEAEKRLELRTAFLVRTAAEWDEAVAHNPFAEAAEREPGHLVVMFLKDAPDANRVKALRDAIKGPEVVQAVGRALYMIYPEGQGRSRLTIDVVERKLETRGTGRSWNTVLKLAAAVRELRG